MMKFTSWIKSLFQSKAKSKGSGPMAKAGQVRSPGKWLKDWYAGFIGMDTKKELQDFQSKKKVVKPLAADDELSKVLEDVLKEAPPGDDKGLFAPKKPK